MASNDNTFSRLSMVSRLMAYQHLKGLNSQLAANALRQLLPTDYQQNITTMEKIIAGEDIPVFGYSYGQADIFHRLMSRIRGHKGSIHRLFDSMQPSLLEAASKAGEYWDGFNGLISRFAVIMVVAWLTVGIYSIKVLPAMGDAYTSFGAELPTFTKLILSNQGIYNALMAFIPAAIVAMILLSIYAKRKIAALEPLGRWWMYIPSIRGLGDIYRYFLFITYADTLSQAGLADSTVLAEAADLSGLEGKAIAHDDISHWTTAIKAAATIGSLQQEINYQKSQIATLFNRSITSTKNRVTHFSQIFLGLFIGTLVIAMYLPIFMLGSVAGK